MKTKRGKNLAKTKISDDLRTNRARLDHIPFDLIPKILKGLPAKSLARFLCLSKQYESIIRNSDFMRSYFIKSSTRPQTQSLIFTCEDKSNRKRHFFSVGIRGDSSSYVATYHMKCLLHWYTTVAPSVHGLICYGPPRKLMVYNPSTRRSVTLPEIDSRRLDIYHYYLGYDPINEDYIVMCMTKCRSLVPLELRVLTLRKNGNSWRMIQDCPSDHSPLPLDICINGVLYYEAYLDTDPFLQNKHQGVMSFDVRSEKFELIRVPETAAEFTKMTRYEGKLAVMSFKPAGLSCTCRIDLWVLEDAAKHEWCNKVFALDLCITDWYLQAFCLTDAGEFVFGPDTLSEPPFYVLYYDPKKNSFRKVYIEGITKHWGETVISIFSGQVENLMFL
ncbi:PREDICTED: F-box protein At2g21930-like [Camelina sativa]|uniref:F-box protein At2g21930-like n=1 Tax=Camelina sativa TaxID=90675 RepID=A0ABM0T7F6_CAMSA|nr:PREDICTED: F-box protein At2g21930-like [Camelina sativa]